MVRSPASVGELHPRPPVAPRSFRRSKPLRHPLILDGFRLGASQRFVGLCLHVLSSFQRTGLARAPRLASISPSGEPYELTETSQPLSTIFCGFPIARARFPEGFGGRTTVRGLPDAYFLWQPKRYQRQKNCSNPRRGSEQLFRPARPGHARSTQYMRARGPCQPLASGDSAIEGEETARIIRRVRRTPLHPLAELRRRELHRRPDWILPAPSRTQLVAASAEDCVAARPAVPIASSTTPEQTHTRRTVMTIRPRSAARRQT
jgi:hypothetical protein